MEYWNRDLLKPYTVETYLTFGYVDTEHGVKRSASGFDIYVRRLLVPCLDRHVFLDDK
jgi:hypothetical protein